MTSLLAAHDKPGRPAGIYTSVGMKVLSHYEIGEVLGEGGMGKVYKARDTNLDRQVAIKFLHQWDMGNLAARKRLLHEARIASKLNHSNIVTVHEIAEENGVDLLVMEFVNGRTERLTA